MVDGPVVGTGCGIGALPDGLSPKVCASAAGGVVRFVVVAGLCCGARLGCGAGAPPPVRAAGGVVRFGVVAGLVVVAGLGRGAGAPPPPPARAAGAAGAVGAVLRDGFTGAASGRGRLVRSALATGGADIAAVAPVAAALAGPAARADGGAAVVDRWTGALGPPSFLVSPRRSRQDGLGPRGGGGSQTGTPSLGRGPAAPAGAPPGR